MANLGVNNQYNGQRLGITEPISFGGPTEYDVNKTHELEKYLENVGLYEQQEEAVRREEVLGRLDQIVKHWVKTISRAKGLNEQLVQEANAKIFTFGSYRLGVHSPGADIDTLCVGPRHATREEDFFGELHRMLSEMPEVTELHPVPDAFVPVMRFKFNGVSIDLLYAKLSLWVVPEDLDVSQDSILQNADEQTVRSLNGCRVTDQILRLVPNIQNFRTTLRCMRFWAKRRGVYSNAMESNKGDWDSLFKPYPFFDAYKHYLQIDINAENADDYQKWKGWVESRLRTLTLKIERHTYNMLQCHPHPGEFTDESKPFHSSYFMGLQRKKEVPAGECEKFDIRMTVDEFKQTVNMYTMWKPGMEIRVSYVTRRIIPAFVFPGGIRPTRSSRESKRSLEMKSGLDKLGDGKRRKKENDDTAVSGVGLPRLSASLPSISEGGHAGSPISTATSLVKVNHLEMDGSSEVNTERTDTEMLHPANNGELDRSVQQSPPLSTASVPAASSNSNEAEKVAIEKMMSGPYGAQQDLPELDELEPDVENAHQVEYSGEAAKLSRETSSVMQAVEIGISGATAAHSSSFANGSLEELEPAELTMPGPVQITAPVPKKPLIRLSFTSLGKATSHGS